jgi:acyl-CoA hydrolase
MISAALIDGAAVETVPLDVMPRTEHLAHLEATLPRTGFSHDFPLLADLDVKRAGGSRGTSFAPQLKTLTFWNRAENKLEGVAYFPLSVEGPINCAHGGSIATVLDNVLGTLSMRVLGFGAVTLQLNVTYKKFIPLTAVVKVEAWEISRTDTKINCQARLLSLDDDSVHAEAVALFYRPTAIISFDDAVKMFGRDSTMTKEQVIAMRQERARAKL